MKMSPEQFETLRAACAPLDTPAHREHYRNGRFPRADRCKDVDMRYRWDILYAAAVDCRPFYDAGMHDSHIDTALRRIIPSLKVQP